MGAWRRPSAALLALLVLALGLLHLAARRGARAIDAHLAIAPAGGASQLLAVRAVRAGALAARSAAAGAPPLAWNATGLAGGAEGATPQGWDVALVRIRALATSNLVAVRTNDELVASVRDSEGAGVLFERWALPLPSEARGCARGGGEGRQVFALLSRRTGRFVRARAPGDEREWALTADEPWPADARVRARSPALLAALPASALFEAHGSHVFSCAVGAYVNVRPRGALRTHSDDGPPFGRPAGPLPRGALAIEPIAHALAHVATPLPAAGYTFVSVDYHIATAQDSGATLRSLGMNFVDLSLSGACARVGTCARGLHVLTRENGFTLCPQPHALRRAFFARYRQSELVRHADAFICSHPAVRASPATQGARARAHACDPTCISSSDRGLHALRARAQAMCELFLPFGRALVVVVTTNLELARENGERWRAWLSAIQRLDADPRCVLGANSVYDQQYVRYFTGVEPLLLPSLASYVEPVYAPSRPQVLLAPAHSAAAEQQLDGVRAHAPDVQFARLRDLYPSYDFADLAAHPAVVFVPYTKSVMTFFELYRMGVPLFFPSLNVRAALLPRRSGGLAQRGATLAAECLTPPGCLPAPRSARPAPSRTRRAPAARALGNGAPRHVRTHLLEHRALPGCSPGGAVAQHADRRGRGAALARAL